MITRTSLADEIDLLDADIKVLNDSKTAAFTAYREQLIAAGVAKENVKKEIDATKAAIKRRRATTKDEDAVLENEALADEIYIEITAKSRAPRACVENIEEFDAETGEILDDRRSDAGLNIVTKHTEIQVPSSEQSEGNGSRDHQHVHSRQTDEAKHGGQDGEPAGADHATGPKVLDGRSPVAGESRHHCDVSEDGAGQTLTGNPTPNTGEGAANTALPAKPKVSFRPNCQHPENCASGTRDHCWSCRRAMQKSEEPA